MRSNLESQRSGRAQAGASTAQPRGTVRSHTRVVEIVDKAVSGVKMNPIAARCGSRLNNTFCDAVTLASASPRMNPL